MFNKHKAALAVLVVVVGCTPQVTSCPTPSVPTTTTTTTTSITLASTTTSSTSTLTTTSTTSVVSIPVQRDLFTWPFATNSIWNTPIGSGARYVPAGLDTPNVVETDIVRIIKTKTIDPLRPVYNTVDFFGGGRCDTRVPTGVQQRVPDSLYIPDARSGWTPNSIVTFVDPDGRTMRSYGVTARCLRDANGREPGQTGYGAQPINYALFALPADDARDGQSLAGAGIYGAHFGSFLSGVGGHLRVGELTGSGPIRHVLAFNLWGKANLFYDRSLTTESGQLRGAGYRWPAWQPDSYAGQSDGYHGSNPAAVMGSLFALPPSVTPQSLNITSAVGLKLFYALQNYGSYVVDDTYWDAVDFGMEESAAVEYRNRFGHDFGEGTERGEVQRMIAALSVVDNNSPSTIGGGGTPRAPLAPPVS